MKIIFDSVAELDEFLAFAIGVGDTLRGAKPAAPRFDTPLPAIDPAIALTPEQLADINTSAHEPEDAEQSSDAPSAANPSDPEPTKRKRRTKAEMEAARAAEQLAQMQPPEHDDVLDSAPPAQMPPTAPDLPADPVLDPPAASGNDPTAWIATRALEIGPLEPIVHLTRCREFIGAKGMQAYTESFALVGLPSNVMGYTPDQCATHAAALEFLAQKG